jgi:hypothetical protein
MLKVNWAIEEEVNVFEVGLHVFGEGGVTLVEVVFDLHFVVLEEFGVAL